jgi:hypothetical protein
LNDIAVSTSISFPFADVSTLTTSTGNTFPPEDRKNGKHYTSSATDVHTADVREAGSVDVTSSQNSEYEEKPEDNANQWLRNSTCSCTTYAGIYKNKEIIRYGSTCFIFLCEFYNIINI